MKLKFIISLLIPAIYTYFKTKKTFHMLQQNWYNEGNRYLKWIFKNKKQVFVSLDILFLCFIIFNFIHLDSIWYSHFYI